MKFLRRFQPTLRFPSYAEALLACDGYQAPDLVRVVHEKTKRCRHSINGRPAFFADLLSAGPNVLDFGGACGAHYFQACSIRPDLRWHVVETPAMVAEARDMEDGHLRFFDSLAEAKRELSKIDLLFTSGALQYVPNPYGTLQELVKCGGTRIYITRLPLTDRDIISIQKSKLSENGPGCLPPGFRNSTVRYPVTFMRKDKFEQILETRYTIQPTRGEQTKAYWAGQWIDMFGYIGHCKTQ